MNITNKVNQATNKQGKAPKTDTPFYKKTAFIVVMLIFFPPVGIPIFFKFMDKPNKTAKIAISVIWCILWVVILVSAQMDSFREYDIDGNKVKVECSTYCSKMEAYGDKDIVKILATAGVRKITFAPENLKDNQGEIMVDTTVRGADKITVVMADGKVSKVYNTAYPTIVYYSTNADDKVVAYPAESEITAVEEQKQKEAEVKKAEEAAKKAEEERKKEEEKAQEALVPSASGTAELCEKAFHSKYPYNGSKVHSIMGVIVNDKYSADSRLYKVEVTIQNAYGASYDAVMECVVQKTGEMIKITSFNVY